MTKKKFPLFRSVMASCCALVLMSCDQSGPAPVDVTGLEPIEAARAKLKAIAAEDDFPGVSGAIAVDGKIVLAEGFGVKDIETTAAPDAQTMYRVYSVSKPLTGLALLTLIDQGKLDPDNQVGAYLADVPDNIKSITVRQLAGHVGGIRHYKDGEWMRISTDHCESPKEALNVFINDPLIATPGQKYSYSSFGFVLLSAVLENAAGQSFGDYFQENLFRPSNATRIGLDDPTSPRPENMTSFYTEGRLYGLNVASPLDNSCKFGGGGFNASPTALAKVFANALEGGLLATRTMEYALTPIVPVEANDNPPGFGMGVGTTVENLRYSAMSGSGEGGRSALVMLPDEKIVVVIMANASGRQLTQDAFEIAKLFLDDTDTD